MTTPTVWYRHFPPSLTADAVMVPGFTLVTDSAASRFALSLCHPNNAWDGRHGLVVALRRWMLGTLTPKCEERHCGRWRLVVDAMHNARRWSVYGELADGGWRETPVVLPPPGRSRYAMHYELHHIDGDPTNNAPDNLDARPAPRFAYEPTDEMLGKLNPAIASMISGLYRDLHAEQKSRHAAWAAGNAAGRECDEWRKRAKDAEAKLAAMEKDTEAKLVTIVERAAELAAKSAATAIATLKLRAEDAEAKLETYRENQAAMAASLAAVTAERDDAHRAIDIITRDRDKAEAKLVAVLRR